MSTPTQLPLLASLVKALPTPRDILQVLLLLPRPFLLPPHSAQQALAPRFRMAPPPHAQGGREVTLPSGRPAGRPQEAGRRFARGGGRRRRGRQPPLPPPPSRSESKERNNKGALEKAEVQRGELGSVCPALAI